MKRIIMLMLLCICHLAYAQKDSDSLSAEKKQNEAYDIHVKSTSKDGKWLAFFKMYDDNSDTLVIANRKEPEIQYKRLKVLDHEWSRDQQLILKYKDRTEIFDYAHNKKKILPACQTFGILHKENIVALNTSQQVLLYDLKGHKVMDSINRVVKVFYIDGGLYLQTKNNEKYHLIHWSDGKAITIYKSSDQVSNLLALQNNTLLIFEKKENLIHDIVYYDVSLKKEYRFSQDQLINFNSATAYQRSDGKIIINSEKIKDKSRIDVPEIWNTSDNNIIDKFKRSFSTKFLWTPVENNSVQLGTDKLNRVVDINNNDYFLAFSFSELQDYTVKKTPSKVYRYNIMNGTYDYIDTISSNVNYSPDGKYLLYKKGNCWKLLEINSLKYKNIENMNFSNPYFTTRSKIYFDGSEGIWDYDIKLDKLRQRFNREKGNYKILNFKFNSKFTNYFFELTFNSKVINEFNYLFEVNNELNSTISVFEHYDNRYHNIINSTQSKIVLQKTDNAKNAYLFTEENFNQPKQIIDVSRLYSKKVIFRSNDKDEAQSIIKAETIKYKNTVGVGLKGILYYPLHYKEGKKYPMVVHVYQIQSDKINQFPLLLENDIDTGFSIRTLIEKGYFVYMPDIVFDNRGTGISALDCVNKSLDALIGNPLIDFEKIALTGHSHGGYITNFIATRSVRFATFVSGAGNSDIIRSYYSLNEEFISPFYWQFESGQYEMNIPFVKDKKLYFKNNPIHYVEQVSKPVLLWTGKKDKNIEWGQVMEFFIGLKRNNKIATLLEYPDEGHTFSSKTTAKDLHNRILQWFGYYLKEEQKPNWID
ncbi:alpha/beta hydrolase family protein [Epilithonimonas vandammei]|uniref:alpha/beta hydrolase family protein n=1 Tax=Epilithonimonas vandammei TaxID=2487072 RepID=UPI0028AB9BB7|nr:prolyl oligopeptidase family serine peptidase [Epilithonimonas vandammei]